MYFQEESMFKKLLYGIICALVFNANLFAGTTGKISGRVLDADNREPIPGINIIIEGTTLGAATDVDGIFVINNISPGTYAVVASGVGLQKKRFYDVKVVADFTTRLDFEMSSESITTETVVVRAEVQMVRKDLTSSQTSIDSEQIQSLPVESVTQLLSLQAGVTQGVDGAIHIRGGRDYDTQFSVNGVSIVNPYNNSRSVSVATNAIQELSVVSGTFNAEYGNALSGIVNTVTKEGSEKYRGSFSAYTGDHLSSHNDIFNNIDEIDPLNNVVTEMTLSGPVPYTQNKISFFVSGRYNNDKGYLYGKREFNTADSVYKDKFNPNDIRIASNGDGSTVAMNTSESVSTTAKLTFRPFSTFKINLDMIYSASTWKPYVHELKYTPDAVNDRYSWGLLNILEIRHALSNRTFYTFRASYNIDDSKRYLYPLLDADGNEVDFHAGMSLEGLHADPRYQPDYKSRTEAAPVAFRSGGTFEGSSQSHSYQRTQILGAKFDLTSQINNSHEIKAGGQWRYYTINSQYFEILRDSLIYLRPTILSSNTTRNNKYERNPFEFSLYVQDKMEFDKLIVNVGLRYDFFNAQSKYSTDTFYPTPYDPTIPSTIDRNTLLADAEIKQQLSPRIGVSFPITDKGIIHFSYGHFFQLPPLSYLFTNSEYEFSFGTPYYGNANLNPEKTISYELGLQQQLLDNLAFNITGYFKDVRDLLAPQTIRISGESTYFTYVNKDYANIKGIVFSLTKRRTPSDRLGFTLDYTFQTAEGNDFSADAFFLDLSSGRQTEKIPVFLDWDKSHQLNATLSYGVSDDWNVTFVSQVGTGLPYTPEVFEKQVFLRPNSERRPLQAKVDLLAEKTFNAFGFDLSFFVKVFNLFDTLNENVVFASTGRSNYTLSATRAPALETDRLAKIYPEVKTANEVYNNPAYYLSPREVRFGVSVDF
ncbi:MAG: TonB-dependent receptor [Ignavibacteriae bacterium HGW-Ignavibacteriae-2]|jgi:outer membrane receptor protein involved in Fe transport|nr:MAG: TonB-dependent receptor [Ignavibacteriae bacterium HGW-Ignavibacteriae-2]